MYLCYRLGYASSASTHGNTCASFRSYCSVGGWRCIAHDALCSTFSHFLCSSVYLCYRLGLGSSLSATPCFNWARRSWTTRSFSLTAASRWAVATIRRMCFKMLSAFTPHGTSSLVLHRSFSRLFVSRSHSLTGWLGSVGLPSCGWAGDEKPQSHDEGRTTLSHHTSCPPLVASVVGWSGQGLGRLQARCSLIFTPHRSASGSGPSGCCGMSTSCFGAWQGQSGSTHFPVHADQHFSQQLFVEGVILNDWLCGLVAGANRKLTAPSTHFTAPSR